MTNKTKASEILAKLRLRAEKATFTISDLTVRPNIKAAELIGETFSIENALLVQRPFNNGEIGERVEVDVVTERGKVATDLPINEPSCSLVVYFEQPDAEPLTNVTFMRQGHTLYVQTVDVAPTEPTENATSN